MGSVFVIWFFVHNVASINWESVLSISQCKIHTRGKIQQLEPDQSCQPKVQHGVPAAADSADNGICKLLVEKKNYTCQEHMVVYMHLFTLIQYYRIYKKANDYEIN